MPSIVCFMSTCVHLDNNINNFQELQVCPSSINIEEVTQKTVNILTNRFGFQPIGQLFNNSANSCTDLKIFARELNQDITGYIQEVFQAENTVYSNDSN